MEVTSPVRAEIIDIVYREPERCLRRGEPGRAAAPRRVGGEGTSRHRSCRTAPHVAPPRPGGRGAGRGRRGAGGGAPMGAVRRTRNPRTQAGDFFISGVELLYRSEFLYPCARALNMFELAAA